jgi:hypothetical protein
MHIHSLHLVIKVDVCELEYRHVYQVQPTN